jgi:hypothetical protein
MARVTRQPRTLAPSVLGIICGVTTQKILQRLALICPPSLAAHSRTRQQLYESHDDRAYAITMDSNVACDVSGVCG